MDTEFGRIPSLRWEAALVGYYMGLSSPLDSKMALLALVVMFWSIGVRDPGTGPLSPDCLALLEAYELPPAGPSCAICYVWCLGSSLSRYFDALRGWATCISISYKSLSSSLFVKLLDARV